MRVLLLLACALGACASGDRAPRAKPAACAIAQAAGSTDPLSFAREAMADARRTGDPGHYTVAEAAVACRLHAAPEDLEAEWLGAHLALQFHDFAEAEARARALVDMRGAWQDHMLLGDAQMEQGDLEPAAAQYALALGLRPGLAIYDRLSWLAWLQGDLAGAIVWEEMAVSAGTPQDPEPLAWALTRLGWLRAQTGAPAPELQHALQLLPGYPEAHYRRGLLRLAVGHPGAADDLRAAGARFDALRALADLDPSIDLDTFGHLDPRGYAIWLADHDPERALRLLDAERRSRQDATTQMAWAYATHRAGGDGTAAARQALATGFRDPEVLRQGAVVLGTHLLSDRTNR